MNVEISLRDLEEILRLIAISKETISVNREIGDLVIEYIERDHQKTAKLIEAVKAGQKANQSYNDAVTRLAKKLQVDIECN